VLVQIVSSINVPQKLLWKNGDLFLLIIPTNKIILYKLYCSEKLDHLMNDLNYFILPSTSLKHDSHLTFRFQQTMCGLRKDNRHVDFPFSLNLAPFCSATSLSATNVPAGSQEILYDLFGVVEHSGSLKVTSYVLNYYNINLIGLL
jgi:hypothetical protein